MSIVDFFLESVPAFHYLEGYLENKMGHCYEIAHKWPDVLSAFSEANLIGYVIMAHLRERGPYNNATGGGFFPKYFCMPNGNGYGFLRGNVEVRNYKNSYYGAAVNASQNGCLAPNISFGTLIVHGKGYKGVTLVSGYASR